MVWSQRSEWKCIISCEGATVYYGFRFDHEGLKQLVVQLGTMVVEESGQCISDGSDLALPDTTHVACAGNVHFCVDPIALVL